MSASRERKKRMTQEGQPAPQKNPPKKKKVRESVIFAIVVILIPVIVFGSVFGYQAYWRNATVLTVGDHTVTTSQFNYFYRGAVNSMYSTYGNYLSLLGIDTSVALDEQKNPSAENDQTWAEYFSENAKTNAVNLYTVYDAAKAQGFTLSEEALHEIEEELNAIKTYAAMYSMDEDEYVAALYGKGCDMDSYRAYLELSHINDAYISSLTYTDQEIADRYAKDPTEFDTVSYYLYTVTASSFAEKKEDGTTAEVTDENRTSAKEAAEAMQNEFNTEDEKVTFNTDRFKSEITSSATEEIANWLYSEAKVDNVKLFQNEDTYYVVKMVGSSDNAYQTANALQIYIANDKEGEEPAEGTKTAAERMEELRNALKEDASKEKFEEYISTYSDNSSNGTVTQASRRSVSNEDMRSWLFDETRKDGDYKEFEDENGTYVLLFTGYDKLYKDMIVSNTLTNEWFEALTGAATYDYDADAAKHANVGLILNEVFSSASN